jgi:Rrf2 family protein
MWISKRTDYAGRVLTVMSMDPDQVFKLSDLADRTRVPTPMLEQVMVVLRTSGFVRSIRGRNGGYRLNKPAAEMTLEQVVRAFQGPLAPIGCATRKSPEPCPLSECCGMLDIWSEVRDATIRLLRKTDFASLAARAGGPWLPGAVVQDGVS